MLRKLASILFASFAAASGYLLLDSVPSSAFSLADVNPIYKPDLNEDPFFDPNGNPGSFGYFFDTETDGTIANALGVSIFPDWVNSPSSTPVTVTLWRYEGFFTGTVVYDQIVQRVLAPSDVASVPGGFGYYWLEIPFEPLQETGSAVDPFGNIGYAISVSGDYTPSSDFPFLQGGTGSFIPDISFLGSGFNNTTSFYYADFPFPLDCVLTPAGDRCDPTVYGYFNPNVSYYVVPGPLSLMGAAAGYGMSRRLRRRIRQAR